jgi:hypothetical protein
VDYVRVMACVRADSYPREGVLQGFEQETSMGDDQSDCARDSTRWPGADGSRSCQGTEPGMQLGTDCAARIRAGHRGP